MKQLFACVLVVSSLVGCASVPMGDPQKDAALKTFKAPEGKSGVYIYRNETLGAAVHMDVAIDGEATGQTAANTYLYKELPPGKHVITSKTENLDTLEIETKPGLLTYVWQEVKMGFLSARSKLHLVSEEQGKKGVMETKLAESK